MPRFNAPTYAGIYEGLGDGTLDPASFHDILDAIFTPIFLGSLDIFAEYL